MNVLAWRISKRWLSVAALALLGGLVLNVGLAWTVAAMQPSRSHRRMWPRQWPVVVPSTWNDVIGGSQDSGFGYSSKHWYSRDGDEKVIVRSFGLPWRSMQTITAARFGNDVPSVSVRGIPVSPRAGPGVPRELPVHVLPLPFAMNTAVLSGMIATVVVLVRIVRRRIRISHHGCRECGYDMGALVRCPECGTASRSERA